MKCPICGTQLTIEQSLDHGYYESGNDERMWLDVAGYCENCRKGFVWTQHYTLVNEDGLADDE